uniref:Transposase (putative) gypsy type domain-containing protein n=1 Tax=Tanacetum cinerariifolium TaxID=118510 RepID=A0A6L2LC06_TANCI|nr:hypothetical protein [Tanacetum cinerariifolium]
MYRVPHPLMTPKVESKLLVSASLPVKEIRKTSLAESASKSSVSIARPGFRYLFVLPSSFEVAYASATFSCIGSITDIKSVLTQRALKSFCETFHIPDEVHLQLPSPNQTIHEMPTGKIGVYTRFFEYANFRLPLSTFLVNMLKHHRIHISQLSVIGAAKVSHFEILCRVHGIEPTVGLFRFFYVNSKNKGWMSFSKRQGSDTVCYTKPLDSLKELDFFSFIRTADPMKVRIGERQRDEDEPKLLETTVGRVVLLLPAKQGDSASGGHDVGIQLVDVVAETIVEDVALAQPKRQKKRKTKVVDAGEPSHPAKKLKDDLEAPGGPTVGGVMPTLPFVTSSISTTSEREGGDHTELLAGANLRTIGAPQRTSMPIITSESHPIPGGFSDYTGSNFLIGGIRTVIDPDFNLQKVYIPQWNVTNGSCFDDGGVYREMIDKFSPSKYNIRDRRRLNSVVEENDALLKAIDEEIGSLKAQLVSKEAEAAEAIRLRVETSNFEAVEKSLQSEVAALKERNNLLETEKSGLDVKVADLATSVKVREQEVADLDAMVTSVKLQNDNLVDQEKVMAYENCLSQLEKFQDDRMREMNDKFDKLDTDLVEMALHMKERFYPHLLTTIFGRRWLLTHGLEIAIAKCLNSTEYLSTLGAAIGKAIEKGMQDGLSAEITHGAKELKSNKDASIDTIMNLLRLEDSLAEKLGLTESQPHVNQLMVPIHHSSDQRVVGASALSLSMDVSNDYEITHAEGEKNVGANANPFPDVDDAKLNIPQ